MKKWWESRLEGGRPAESQREGSVGGWRACFSVQELLHSGILELSSVDAVAGTGSRWLPRLLLQTWARRSALGLPSAWPSPWLRWSLSAAKKMSGMVRDESPPLAFCYVFPCLHVFISSQCLLFLSFKKNAFYPIRLNWITLVSSEG